MLGDLENETTVLSTLELDLEGVEDRRQVVGVEVDIDNGTNDGLDSTGLDSGRGGVTTGSDCKELATISTVPIGIAIDQ